MYHFRFINFIRISHSARASLWWQGQIMIYSNNSNTRLNENCSRTRFYSNTTPVIIMTMIISYRYTRSIGVADWDSEPWILFRWKRQCDRVANTSACYAFGLFHPHIMQTVRKFDPSEEVVLHFSSIFWGRAEGFLRFSLILSSLWVRVLLLPK